MPNTADLHETLRAAAGADAVLPPDSISSRAEAWSSSRPCQARAVVRPGSPREVSALLRACHALRQPVVPYGGGTGLVAGAIATEQEVLFSLERMRQIEEIDAAGRVAVVQAGVTLQALQEAATTEGLFFPLDLGARGTATVGGAVATNAGGNRVLRYGMMREQVLGLEAVLADGTTLTSLNRLIKNNAGYDLRQVFVGSEGTLGAVTRVVVRLREAPQSQNLALLAVPDFASLIRLLKQTDRGLGGTLSAFEVMWPDFYELVTNPHGCHEPPLPHGSPFYCLVESLGGDEQRDRAQFEEVLGKLLDEGVVTDAVIAESQAQIRALWALRDDVEQVLKIGHILMFDVGLPITQMESYLNNLRGCLAARWPAMRCVVWGHVGDSNLHIWISVQDSSADARLAIEALVYGGLSTVGGTVSADHGIGLEKLHYLGFSRSKAELATMFSLKRALDPLGILNPGRVLTLSERNY
jgi:FAD/FMN-containing dehydrogenase